MASDLLDTTTITTPETVEVWTFCGERSITDPSLDPRGCSTRIGSLERKDIYARAPAGGQGTLLQTETFTWDQPLLSEQSFPFRHMPLYYQSPHATLPSEHTIIRDGEQFTTLRSNYDPLVLKPTLVSGYRNGNLSDSRQEGIQLWIDSANWIVRTSSERLYDYVINDHLSGQREVGANGTSRSFNPDGTVSSQTAGGATDTFTYRPDGLVSTYTTYGRGGHFEARSYALGIITELYSTGRTASLHRSINAEGYVGTETDWEGHTTTLHYDGLGRVRRVETPRPDDEDTVVTRSFSSREQVVTRGGYVQRTRFDGLGRVIEVQTDDILVRTERDALGRVVFESDPVSAAAGLPAQCVNLAAADPCAHVTLGCAGVCSSYDALGRLTQQVYSVDDSTTQYSYPNPLQTVVTNAKGQVTTITHERFGDPDEDRPVRIEQEEGVTTSIAYYRNGRPFTVTQDGDGTLHGPPRTYFLDEDHRLLAEFHPESHWRRYVYDTYGRLWRSHYEEGTLAEQNRINFAYDAVGRVRSYGPQGTTVAFTYDNNNRVLTANYQGANWTYGYDANGNRTTESLQVDGRTFAFARDYDGLDHLTRLVYPSTRAVDYVPDVLGRPTRASPHITSLTYQPNGLLHTLTYANGHSVRYTPDSDKPALPRRIDGGPIDLTYTYDVLGNVEAISDAAVSGHDISLGYDRINRLTSATGPWGTASYAYDAKNGLSQMTLNGLSADYAYGYDAASPAGTYAPHRLEQTTGRLGTRFGYDRRGNATVVETLPDPSTRTETERRVDEFTYDWRDRPTRHVHRQVGLQDFRGTGTIIGVDELVKTTEHQYDGFGQRVKKGSDHFFVYSGSQLLYDEDPQEKRAREYIYVGALGVAEVVEDCAGASGQQPWCMSADQPPKVAILNPRIDDRPDHRTSVVLSAVAFDAESGDLSSAIQWYEALATVGAPFEPPPATFLGSGKTLDVGRLGVGYHRIEARLSAGSSQEVVETVQFEIVAGPNVAPTISSPPSSSISVPVETALTVDMTSWFTDGDGDPLTYTVDGLPSWLSLTGSLLTGVRHDGG